MKRYFMATSINHIHIKRTNSFAVSTLLLVDTGVSRGYISFANQSLTITCLEVHSLEPWQVQLSLG